MFKPIHLICALENGKNKTASRNIKRAKKWYTTYYNKKQIKGKDRRSTRNSQYSEWIPKKKSSLKSSGLTSTWNWLHLHLTRGRGSSWIYTTRGRHEALWGASITCRRHTRTRWSSIGWEWARWRTPTAHSRGGYRLRTLWKHLLGRRWTWIRAGYWGGGCARVAKSNGSWATSRTTAVLFCCFHNLVTNENKMKKHLSWSNQI